MSEIRHCPSCGAELAVDSPMGLCVPCLLAPVVSSDSARFGDYELLDDGKEGGMGRVYRARQISLDRIVALKMIRGGELATAAQVQRFQAEAHAAASLDHPNIVPIYEVGEHDGRDYFAMKWLAGGSLADVLRAPGDEAGKSPHDGPFNLRHSAQFMAKVAHAIHHAHQHGIIHRDLKPSNILLDAQGEPQVSDFGLAKRLDREAALTLSDQALGTPSYMAPEQAAGKARDVTTAADIYSLGAILYELLTGQPPFVAETPAATMQKVLSEEPKRPSSVIPKLPRDLETICLKCLEKEPHLRYPSAESLAEDLDRWLRGEPLLAKPSGLWGRTQKWARRNPAIAILSCAAGLVAFLGFAGVMWELKQTRSALGQNQHLLRFANQLAASVEPHVDDELRLNLLDAEAKRLDNDLKGRPDLQADLRRALAASYVNLGALGKAEQNLREAVGIRRGLRIKDDAELALLLNDLGVVVHKRAMPTTRGDAEPYFREALVIEERAHGPDSVELDEIRGNLAFLLRRTQRVSDAEALYAELYTRAQSRYGLDSTNAALAACRLVEAMIEHRKFDAAAPLAQHAWDVLALRTPDHWRTFDAESLLGGVYLEQKDYARAEPLLLSGYEGMKKKVGIGSFHGRTQRNAAVYRLKVLYEIIGPPEKAQYWRHEHLDWSNRVAEANIAAGRE